MSTPRTVKLGEDDYGELVAIEWPDGNVEQSLQAQIASTPQTNGNGIDRHVGEIGPVPRVSMDPSAEP